MDNKLTKIVGEIGINHTGSIDKAIELIQMAYECGADMVKFQKRTPELSVPKAEWDDLRCTPFGIMSKIDYRRQVEFGIDEYITINEKCGQLGIKWFVSVWDLPSYRFVAENFPAMPYVKIPSALMEDRVLQEVIIRDGKKIIISTGMHHKDEIEDHLLWLVNTFESDVYNRIIVMACNSSYPVDEREVNLKTINTLRKWPFQIGFSSHSTSPFVPIHAIAYAQPAFIEVHITLDRAGPSSDDGASLERKGMELLVRERDRFYCILGDGKLQLYNSELSVRKKLKINIGRAKQ